MKFELGDRGVIANPAELRSLLRSDLLYVKFLKKSTGEEREMNATTRPDLIPEQKLPKTGDGSPSGVGVEKNSDLVSVYVPEVDGWRSFYWGNIVDLQVVSSTAK